MALAITTRNAYPLRRLIFLSKSFTNRLLCTHQDRIIISLEADVMDDFTTQLMQRKVDKWELIRAKRCLNDNQEQIKCTSYKPISYVFQLEDLNSILQDALEVGNKDCIKSAIEWCIKNKTVPDLSLLLQIFSYYSHAGNKNMVLKLIDLCQNLDITVLNQYSYFKHYLAEVTWIKGNINEALKIFDELYTQNVFLRRRIKNMLKYLITDSISNRSEAVLLSIIDFAKQLADNYKDYYILSCIWKCCIKSEWFTDQCIAFDLFEQNEGLRKAVTNDLLYITIVALKNHRTEIVYKILELLIKFDNRTYCRHVLEALFDYKVYQRDLRGCAEIAQWSVAQGIALPSFQQEKFVALLVSPSSNTNLDLNVKVKPKLPKPPDYNFKF